GHTTRHDLVEDVVRSFQGLLRDDTGLLQQVCKYNQLVELFKMNEPWAELTGFDISTSQFAHWAEVDADEFTETGRVIVTHGLGVTESFQDWVSLHDLV